MLGVGVGVVNCHSDARAIPYVLSKTQLHSECGTTLTPKGRVKKAVSNVKLRVDSAVLTGLSWKLCFPEFYP